MSTKSILIRATKTALQTFTGLIGLDGMNLFNATTSKQLLAAGVAALLSAVTNLLTDLEATI